MYFCITIIIYILIENSECVVSFVSSIFFMCTCITIAVIKHLDWLIEWVYDNFCFFYFSMYSCITVSIMKHLDLLMELVCDNFCFFYFYMYSCITITIINHLDWLIVIEWVRDIKLNGNWYVVSILKIYILWTTLFTHAVNIELWDMTDNHNMYAPSSGVCKINRVCFLSVQIYSYSFMFNQVSSPMT